MTNMFLAAWLALDALAFVALLRLVLAGASARGSAFVVVVLQLTAFGAGVASFSASNAAGGLTWATIVSVNVALAVAGLTVGSRWLSIVGLAGTVAAMVLLLLGSLASIAVAACSAIILLGAALLPQSDQVSVVHLRPRG